MASNNTTFILSFQLLSMRYAETTESAPCSLLVGRTVISTSRRKPVSHKQRDLRLPHAENFGDLNLSHAAVLQNRVDLQGQLGLEQLLLGIGKAQVRKATRVAPQVKTVKRMARQGQTATVSRMLDNEKYIGRWIWNKTEQRRDPRTGRRRCFPKPASEWVIQEDESLRIVPQELWEQVRTRRKEVRQSWPGGIGQRGFSAQQGSREKYFPTHLLSGAMVCGKCGKVVRMVLAAKVA